MWMHFANHKIESKQWVNQHCLNESDSPNALLKWRATMKHLSHQTLERSVDGKWRNVKDDWISKLFLQKKNNST